MSEIPRIPYAAARRVFDEVFAEYSVLSEPSRHDDAVSLFLIDVERSVRDVYPCNGSSERAIAALLADSVRLPATRAALGAAFLARGLWPVKAYFNGR